VLHVADEVFGGAGSCAGVSGAGWWALVLGWFGNRGEAFVGPIACGEDGKVCGGFGGCVSWMWEGVGVRECLQSPARPAR